MMTWVRYDDQASIHRKVAPLDDATYRLWREAIEWCARNTTDGVILPYEFPEVSKRATTARAVILVERGLWHEAGAVCDSPRCPPPGQAGWVVHDYLEYQPSRIKVRAEQAAKAERQRKWLEKREASQPASKDASSPPSRGTSRDASIRTSRGASKNASVDASKDDAPSPTPPRRGKGEGKGAPPQAPPAADGDGTPSGAKGENPKTRPCDRCGNATSSAYHRRICAAETAAPQ